MSLKESKEELLSLQDLGHLSKMFNVFFWCLSIDKNVVQIYQYALPNLAGKKIVYECDAGRGAPVGLHRRIYTDGKTGTKQKVIIHITTST